MPGRVYRDAIFLKTNSCGLLDRLRRGGPIAARVVLVAAHPDDETVGAGARLADFQDLSLIHVTDGAPEDLADAQRAGFDDRTAYARARTTELHAALSALGAAPECAHLRLRDQTAALHLTRLARALKARLKGAAVVLTHAYEAGHPDHDACAFAVQAACALIARSGGAPPLRLEFAGYHRGPAGRVVGAFWPATDCAEVAAEITPERLAAKRAAMAAHRSQAEVLAWFDPAVERYRQAPEYDFAAGPPPGRALYDDWGWALTSRRWRELATTALRELELAEAAWV